MSEKLLYVNVLGEYDWEQRKLHMQELTDKDLEVIAQVADEDIKNNKEVLTMFMEKYNPDNPKDVSLKEALELEFADSQATNYIIKTSKLRSCDDENVWHHISAMLFHKDSASMLAMFLGEGESLEAEQVRETLENVLMITGLPETQLQQEERLTKK